MEYGDRDVAAMLRGETAARKKQKKGKEDGEQMRLPRVDGDGEKEEEEEETGDGTTEEKGTVEEVDDRTTKKGRKIFAGVTAYVNGSTASAGVGDQRLKYLFVEHGGRVALGLARRSVTHVVLGSSESGGGLAAGKVQKEIRAKIGGSGGGVRFVRAEWCV